MLASKSYQNLHWCWSQMNPARSASRYRVVCLFLASAVLCLGIVQWSFLPILVQNASSASKPVLEASGGHTAKFAAPYKYLFGSGLRRWLTQSRIIVPRTASFILHLPETSISVQDDFSLSHHPFRAPPSA